MGQACLPRFFWYSYAARGDLHVLISEMLTRSEALMRLRPVLSLLGWAGCTGRTFVQSRMSDAQRQSRNSYNIVYIILNIYRF